MNTASLKKHFESSLFRKMLYIVGIAIAALLIFQGGMFVGYRKARFAYHGGDNYYRAFGGPRHMMEGRPDQKMFSDAHGAAGRIIDINLPTIIVEGSDNIEKVILVKDDTIIRRFRDSIQAEDLKQGDFVVIFGSPNDQSRIEARLIRVMPPPPEEIKKISY